MTQYKQNYKKEELRKNEERPNVMFKSKLINLLIITEGKRKSSSIHHQISFCASGEKSGGKLDISNICPPVYLHLNAQPPAPSARRQSGALKVS